MNRNGIIIYLILIAISFIHVDLLTYGLIYYHICLRNILILPFRHILIDSYLKKLIYMTLVILNL